MALPGPRCAELRATSGRVSNAVVGLRCALVPSRRRVRCACSAASGGASSNGGGDGIEDDASSGLERLRFNKREEELPEALRGLEISEDGFLVDTKTGKVINEFGATRFDVAVRALRGELDPAPWVENTERNTGVLLSKVISFPTRYTFQVVGAPGSEPGAGDAFVADVKAAVCGVCEVAEADAEVTVKPRLGGKYLSIAVTAVARAPEIVNAAYDKLAADSRVRMRF